MFLRFYSTDLFSGRDKILLLYFGEQRPHVCSVSVLFDIYISLVCVVCSQAAELSIKFLSGDRAVEVIQVVGPRLTHLRKYNTVGEHKP